MDILNNIDGKPLNKTKRTRICLLSAALMASSNCIQNEVFTPTEEQAATISGTWEMIAWRLQRSVTQASSLTGLAFLLVFLGLWIVYPLFARKKKSMIWILPLSMLFSLMLLLCTSYFRHNNWQMVFGDRLVFLLSIIKASGMAVAFMLLLVFLDYFEIRAGDHTLVLNKRSVILRTIVFLALWLPYMIVLIPGCTNPDTTDQVAQILHYPELCWTAQRVQLLSDDVLLNNHHPVFHTLLLGLFVKLGTLIHSYFAAFCLYCLLQSVALAFTLSFQCEVIRGKIGNTGLYRFAVLFFALNPMFPLWGMTVMKDVPFAILSWWVIYRVYLYLYAPDKITGRAGVGLALLLIVWMLSRNNSFYILVVMTPFILLYLRKDKKACKSMGIIMLLAILFFRGGIQGVVYPAFHITNNSTQEMYSVPFVQTARVLAEHPGTATEEEQEILLHVFVTENSDVQEIAERYLSQPSKSDRVKEKFNKLDGPAYMGKYLRLWKDWMLKYPGTYLEAFLDLNYSWFTVDSRHDNRYYNGIGDAKIKLMLGDLYNPNRMELPRKALAEFINLIAKLPATSWLVEFSYYTWIYLLLMIRMIRRKKRCELLALCPIYINYLICFVGPVAYMRYAIASLIALPTLLVLAFAEGPLNGKEVNMGE